MLAALRNGKLEPRIPARLANDQLFFGVPHKINQTASALLGEASERYGSSIENLVWMAIPWLPSEAAPVVDPHKEVTRPLVREECSYGVHRFYLGFAAWLHGDITEMYGADIARQFWEKMPFVPKLSDFHPATWVEATGGKPY